MHTSLNNTVDELNLLLLNTDESFVMVDKELVIISFNRQFYEQYKLYFNKEIVKATSILSYAQTQQVSVLRGLYQKVLSGETVDYEFEIVDTHLVSRIIHLRYKPAYNEQGEITGAFVSSRDVTDKRRSELQLRLSENKNRSIIENSIYPFLLCNADAYILDANQAALDLFGYTAEEITGKHRRDILVQDEQFFELVKERESSGKVRGEAKGIRSDGSVFPLELSSVYFTDILGEIKSSTIIFDITERRQAEKQLLESKQELEISKQTYESLFAHNFSAVFSLDPRGYFTSANQVLAEKAELPMEQILKLHYSQFVHPDYHAITHENFENAMKGISKEYVIKTITATGSIRDIILINLPIIVNKKIVGVYCIANDITVERESKRRLQTALDEKQRILDSSLDIICTIDKNDRFIETNQASKTLWGYEPAELIGKNYFELIPADEQSVTYKIFSRVRAGESVRNFENQSIRKDSTLSYMIWSFSYDKEEGIIYGVGGDISEKKQIELQKEFERNNREALINSSRDLIWSLDRSLRLISANKAFIEGLYNVTGIKLESGDPLLIDHPYANHVHSLWKNLYERALSGEFITEEIFISFDDKGGGRWHETSFNPIYQGNEIIGVACYSRDITSAKQYEESLKGLNDTLNQRAEELASSNSELEQFAYIASHDLQEPLRMVTGFLTQLEKKYNAGLDETARKYIWFAVDGAARMRKIISDLLEYSRYGRQQFAFEDVDTKKLLDEVMQLDRNLIAENSATITYGHLPVVYAAKTPLHQVFHNLISNAIKYKQNDQRPEIHISSEITDEYWQFEFRDNGIGISEEYFQKVFVIFQRLHNKQEYTGTGIGLAIVKKIIDNHKGRIWVESQPGKGSSFFFTIPFRQI